MRLSRTSLLPCSLERSRAEIARPEWLAFVSAPMLSYEPLDPPEFPTRWQGRQYRVTLRLGGRLPIGQHTLDIEMPPSGPTGTEFHDDGFSDLIKTWDHRILLEEFHGMTRYTDRVRVSAGVLTPVVWLFAWLFYRHRQQRWLRLITGGFDYTQR